MGAEVMKLMSLSSVDDGAGGREGVATEIATIRPRSVIPVRGAEGSDAGALRAEATYLIVMRRRADVTPTGHYLVWSSNGSQKLNIREVRDPGPRESFMTVVAETGAVSL